VLDDLPALVVVPEDNDVVAERVERGVDALRTLGLVQLPVLFG